MTQGAFPARCRTARMGRVDRATCECEKHKRKGDWDKLHRQGLAKWTLVPIYRLDNGPGSGRTCSTGGTTKSSGRFPAIPGGRIDAELATDNTTRDPTRKIALEKPTPCECLCVYIDEGPKTPSTTWGRGGHCSRERKNTDHQERASTRHTGTHTKSRVSRAVAPSKTSSSSTASLFSASTSSVRRPHAANRGRPLSLLSWQSRASRPGSEKSAAGSASNWLCCTCMCTWGLGRRFGHFLPFSRLHTNCVCGNVSAIV